MVRPASDYPTPAELEVLQVIWDRGPSTVREVMEALDRDRPRAYTSVMSLMNVMASKRQLGRRRRGRAYVYSARLRPDGTRSQMLVDLLDRVFDGSAHALVVHLLREARPDSNELREIRRAIDAFRKEQNPS
jgi:BlaI family penicillinase repressor